MRLKINGYEVEVKAMGYGSTRFNKQDTMAFLCSLCCDLIEARDSYENKNLFGSVGVSQKSIDSIHGLLDENHYNPIK